MISVRIWIKDCRDCELFSSDSGSVGTSNRRNDLANDAVVVGAAVTSTSNMASCGSAEDQEQQDQRDVVLMPLPR